MSASPSPSGFRERLAFDAARGEWRDETRRYMMIRPEALMGMFRRLEEPARGEALAALAASIVEQGGDSARAYRAQVSRVLGADDAQALLDTVAATAPELGWGVWNFSREGQALTLRVRNSPFAAGFGPSESPVCAPIVGMMTAVASLVHGAPWQAVEVSCAATRAAEPSDAAECRFEARPVAAPGGTGGGA